MMTGEHPDEVTLLAYVEGEPTDDSREAVAAHVGSCADCRARVGELEAGRVALRAAAPLELPAERAETLLVDLPRRERARRLHISPMRLATVLAPVAALVAIAIGIASLDGGGDEEAGGGAGEGAPAMEAQRQDDAAGGATGVSGDLVRKVQGPPEDVAAVLRSRGFEVEVLDGAVLVRNASAEDVRRVLAERASGPVEVEVRD